MLFLWLARLTLHKCVFSGQHITIAHYSYFVNPVTLGYEKKKSHGMIVLSNQLTYNHMTFSCTLSQIPNEKQIARMLKKIIFGKTIRCPDCGRACYVQVLEKDRKWRCKKCRNKFSLISSTWLKSSKLPLQAIVCLVWCWQKQLNVEQTKSMLGD